MTINNVSRVGKIDLGAGPIQVEAPRPAENSAQTDALQEEKPVEQKPSESNSEPVMNGDVHLKFIVNEKTHDVIVLVLDRTSRRVIRTIPTEELNNLSRGDLVTVFA